MGWGGIIAGAVTGGAQAVQDTAVKQIDQNSKMDMLRLQQEMEKDKLNLAEQIRREGKIADATGDVGAATREAMGLNSVAQAKADVTGASAKLDAASAAGLPGKEADYAREQFGAGKQLATEKANQAATDIAGAAVLQSNTPGYLKALKDKSIAEGAAHLQVANAQLSQALTMAKKPDIVTDADGNILMRSWDPKTNSVATQPLMGADNKPMKGPKDLDQRTMKMVDAILVEAKAELDPDKRQAAVQTALKLLQPKPVGDAAAAPAAGSGSDPLNLRSATKPAGEKVTTPNANGPTPNGIQAVPGGRGTFLYQFQNQRYGTLKEAQDAKDFFENAWKEVERERNK